MSSARGSRAGLPAASATYPAAPSGRARTRRRRLRRAVEMGVCGISAIVAQRLSKAQAPSRGSIIRALPRAENTTGADIPPTRLQAIADDGGPCARRRPVNVSSQLLACGCVCGLPEASQRAHAARPKKQNQSDRCAQCRLGRRCRAAFAAGAQGPMRNLSSVTRGEDAVLDRGKLRPGFHAQRQARRRGGSARRCAVDGCTDLNITSTSVPRAIIAVGMLVAASVRPRSAR